MNPSDDDDDARRGLERLWAGWRLAYVEAGEGAAKPEGRGTLFERLLALEDDRSYVVWRGTSCAALLNAYPYTNGHLMVLPRRAAPDLEDLSADETLELWTGVRDAVTALRRAYGCDGVNVGLNLGSAAGAGVPDHLHVHVVPRWGADTNFMTTVAETRVLPEALDVTCRRLRAAWPG